MTDLTLEELAKLAREYEADPEGYRMQVHSAVALLAMARELVRLRTRALRVTHRDVTEDELSHVAELAIDARNSLLTPGGSSAPVVRWLMWQEDRGLAVALELLTRNQELTRLKSALEHIRQHGDICAEPPGIYYMKSADRVCEYAKLLGWSDPTTPKAEAKT